MARRSTSTSKAAQDRKAREAKAAATEAPEAPEAVEETTTEAAEADTGLVFEDELPKTERNAPPSRRSAWIDRFNSLVDAGEETYGKWATVHTTGTPRTANSVAADTRKKLREGLLDGLSGDGAFEVRTRGKDIKARYLPGVPNSAIDYSKDALPLSEMLEKAEAVPAEAQEVDAA